MFNLGQATITHVEIGLFVTNQEWLEVVENAKILRIGICLKIKIKASKKQKNKSRLIRMPPIYKK